MRPLYEMAGQYRQLTYLLQSCDNELTDEMREKFKAEMEACIDSLENKAVNVAAYIQDLAVEEKAIQTAVTDMESRQKKVTKKIEFLKEYLRAQLEACGLSEITKSPYYVIKIKKNPPSVFVHDDAKLESEYVNITVTETPNKALIKEHLEQGVVIHGCELKQTSRIEIK